MAKKQKTEGQGDDDAHTMVWVQSTGHLMEDGVRYKRGDQFETTQERAQALGDLVTMVPEVAN